ncbi:MAG: exodeoxyribonuclease III [Myxococcales bacterium]|nr:exodeoxyribonuclease III [Myxococcales bacterium]
MRITTWNVNGLRAAIKKGFEHYLDRISPDILLLQEIRCFADQLPDHIANPRGWHVQWHSAERPGYAGVAIWSKWPLEDIRFGISGETHEGRVLRVQTAGLQVISVYLPSGSAGEERQQAKDSWMEMFLPWATSIRQQTPDTVIGGDLNIAHTEKDIHNARSNANSSGFLPHERAWFTKLLNSGWIDLVRRDLGSCQGPYSWWSNRGRARELDRGWRIDYLLGTPEVAAHTQANSALILREAGITVSDHAPVSIVVDDYGI